MTNSKAANPYLIPKSNWHLVNMIMCSAFEVGATKSDYPIWLSEKEAKLLKLIWEFGVRGYEYAADGRIEVKTEIGTFLLKVSKQENQGYFCYANHESGETVLHISDTMPPLQLFDSIFNFCQTRDIDYDAVHRGVFDKLVPLLTYFYPLETLERRKLVEKTNKRKGHDYVGEVKRNHYDLSFFNSTKLEVV